MPDYPRPKCGLPTEREGFARDGHKASRRKSHCKACDRKKAAAYYAWHREEKLARMEAKRRGGAGCLNVTRPGALRCTDLALIHDLVLLEAAST